MPEWPNPLDARPPHYAPRAKAVIFLFMAGGPSQLDLFTDKPVLRKLSRPAAAAKFSRRQTVRVSERHRETAGQPAAVSERMETAASS